MREVIGAGSQGMGQAIRASTSSRRLLPSDRKGEIRPGMALTVERTSPDHILVMDLWDLSQEANRDPDIIRRARESPVDQGIAEWLATLSD